MYRRKGKTSRMDEEQGQGSRRSSSSSFWDFSPIRSLFSLRPSIPETPPTPEIIVTSCSSETIVASASSVPQKIDNTNISKEHKLIQETDDQSPLLSIPSSSVESPTPVPSSTSMLPIKKSDNQGGSPDVEANLAASTSGVLMNPLLLETSMPKSMLRLPKTPFRKRSSSYSDLSSRKRLDSDSSDQELRPELTATELRLILLKNTKKADKKQQDKGKYISQLNEILRLDQRCEKSKEKHKSTSDELITDISDSASRKKKSSTNSPSIIAAAGLGAISTGLLPAASVASLLDKRTLGVNNLQLPLDVVVGGTDSATQLNNSSLPRIRSRPRLLSHPEFSLPDSIQSAPIASSAKRFFIPPYFRRPSQLSTVSFTGLLRCRQITSICTYVSCILLFTLLFDVDYRLQMLLLTFNSLFFLDFIEDVSFCIDLVCLIQIFLTPLIFKIFHICSSRFRTHLAYKTPNESSNIMDTFQTSGFRFNLCLHHSDAPAKGPRKCLLSNATASLTVEIL